MGGSPALIAPPRRRHGLAAPGPRLQPLAPADSAACAGCDRRFVGERFEKALRVCPACGRHARVPAPVRARQLGDPGSVEVVRMDLGDRDPLRFDDGVPYPVRLRAARESTGLDDAFLVARARLGGIDAVLACMEFAFMGGSLGSAAGEAFARGCEIAVAEGRALITVCNSGGARMQEGIAALAQMARCTTGMVAVAAAGLPTVALLADPCYGGVTASFATQADLILAEPGARIGFAGGRVIQQAAREELPDGFQRAEFLLAHGMIDAVVPRPQLRPAIIRLLDAYGTACRRGGA